MKLERSEIIPGIWFSAVTQNGQEACLSVQLLTQLEREYATVNAMIPTVLCQGTSRYETEEKLSARLGEIGNMTLSPLVRCVGELQCSGLRAFWPCSDEASDPVMPDAVALVCEAFSSPATKGGLFLPANVEKAAALMEVAADADLSLPEYAVSRCIEEMCCFEDYPAQLPGFLADMYNYKKLSKYYRSLLQTSPVEILYVGPAPAKKVRTELRSALSGMPRGEINYDIGTDIRMNALEDSCRITVETGTEQYPALGFRFGELADEADIPAVLVLARCLEKQLQAFSAEAQVFLDRFKGILVMSAPVEGEALRTEALRILAGYADADQCAAILSASRSAGNVYSTPVSAAELESFTLERVLAGPDCSPVELQDLISRVTPEELSRIASGMEADQLFSLSPETV